MKNSTSLKIPQKYFHMISSVYRFGDDYIVDLNKGYFSETFDGASIICRTQSETLREIRLIKKLEKEC